MSTDGPLLRNAVEIAKNMGVVELAMEEPIVPPHQVINRLILQGYETRAVTRG